MFGNPETTTGGNALKFYATVRLDVRSTTQIKQGDEVRGHRIKVKVVKNKVAPPFRNTEVDLIYGEGTPLGYDSRLRDRRQHCTEEWDWFSFDKERLGQGRDNAIRFGRAHRDCPVIENRVRQLHGLLYLMQKQQRRRQRLPVTGFLQGSFCRGPVHLSLYRSCHFSLLRLCSMFVPPKNTPRGTSLGNQPV